MNYVRGVVAAAASFVGLQDDASAAPKTRPLLVTLKLENCLHFFFFSFYQTAIRSAKILLIGGVNRVVANRLWVFLGLLSTIFACFVLATCFGEISCFANVTWKALAFWRKKISEFLTKMVVINRRPHDKQHHFVNLFSLSNRLLVVFVGKWWSHQTHSWRYNLNGTGVPGEKGFNWWELIFVWSKWRVQNPNPTKIPLFIYFKDIRFNNLQW